MSLYLALPLIAFFANMGLALMTFRGQWQASGKRAFALFLVTMSLWGGLLFMMRSSSSLERAYFWDRLVVVDLAAASVFYLHFTYGFNRLASSRWVLPLAYILFAFVAVNTAMGKTLTGMQMKPYGYAPVWGPAFGFFFLVVYGAILTGAVNIWNASRNGGSLALRNRANYILVGTVISLAGGVTDVLPTLGLPVYPLGIVGNVAFASLATIAMVKVRLLDIRLALRRTFAYALVAAIVGAAYFVLTLAVERAFNMRDVRSTVAFPVLFVIAAVVVIPKLNDRIQRWVDRTFFGERYSSLKALERFSEQMKDITEHQTLADSLVRLVMGATGADFVAFLEPSESGRTFRTVASVGVEEGFELPYVPGGSVLGRLEAHGKVHTADEVSLLPEWQAVPANERRKLDVAEVRLFVPVMSLGDMTGLMLVGRRTGRSYGQEEIDMLRAVANQAATAMENARLYHELASQLEANERRVAAFEHAAARMALEQNPDLAIEQLIEEVIKLIDARFGAVAVWGPEGELTRVISPGATKGKRRRKADTGWVAGLLDRLGVERETDAARGVEEFAPDGLAVPFKCNNAGRGVFYLREKADGSEFTYADIRLVNLFAGLIGVLINNVDVFQSEARERSTLTAIQASMTEGLVVLDPEGKVHYFNAAAERHWSIRAATIVGRCFEEVIAEHVHDFEDPEAALAQIHDLVRGESESNTIELAVAKPDRRDLMMATFPITTPDSAGMTGLLVRDVTEERDLDRRRDTFVSVASHELRTPMTTVVGFTELLLDEVPEGDHRRWLEHIYEDSLRLTSILDDMLDVSRIQSGRLRMTIERVDIEDTIRDVMAGICSTTETHRFELDVAPDLPKALSDQAKTTQVVLNLLSNAIKYSPNGGTVRISAEPDRGGNQVIVRVSDEGIGIAPEDKERVFETFYRARNDETYEIRGTGLGLFIVKSLVEGMGGSMGVDSVLGKGSTFYFTLPTTVAGSNISWREQNAQSLVG